MSNDKALCTGRGFDGEVCHQRERCYRYKKKPDQPYHYYSDFLIPSRWEQCSFFIHYQGDNVKQLDGG